MLLKIKHALLEIQFLPQSDQVLTLTDQEKIEQSNSGNQDVIDAADSFPSEEQPGCSKIEIIDYVERSALSSHPLTLGFSPGLELN